MKTTVFLGPSLPLELAHQCCDARFLPPASRGDITRAIADGSNVIVLIDGLFGDRPSAMHKEILWGLSREIIIIGAASMGALRAAEMADLGMVGHGAVFEAYRDGRCQDDDHVAVLHAPADLGFISLSDAMVDIAFALAGLQESGVIGAAEAALANSFALATHFSARSLLHSLAAAIGEPQATVLATHPDTRIGSRGRKATDTIETLQMLDALAVTAKGNVPPPFQATRYLKSLTRFGFTDVFNSSTEG
jgi:hypothetical protein